MAQPWLTRAGMATTSARDIASDILNRGMAAISVATREAQDAARVALSSRILYGSGAPAAALGLDGNLYRDTAAQTEYGPKASGAWGAARKLVTTNAMASRAALAIVAATAGDAFNLTEAGRGGVFVWQAGNLSAMVAADPRQAVYIPSSYDPTGSAGAWVRSIGPTLDLLDTWFGFSGDPLVNERDRMRDALKLASILKRPFVQTVDIFIEVRDSTGTDPIELFDNTTIRADPNRAPKLIVTHDKTPIFWAYQRKNICLDGVIFNKRGVHSTVSDSAPGGRFYDTYLKPRGAPWYGPGGFQAVLYMNETDDIVANNLKFIAPDGAPPEGCFAWVFAFGGSAQKYARNITIQNCHFDGVIMGGTNSFTDNLSLKNLHSRRYACMPSAPGSGVAHASWPPPHLWYETGSSINTTCDKIYDEGIDAGGGDWGQCCLKMRSMTKFSITNVTSFRDHGCMDWSGTKGRIAGIYARGNAFRSAAGANGVPMIRGLADLGVPHEDITMEDIKVVDTYTGRHATGNSVFALPDSQADPLVNCVFRNIDLELQEWPFDNGSTPFFSFPHTRTTFDVDLRLRTPYRNTNYTMFLVRNTHTAPENCTYSGRLQGFHKSLTQLRMSVGTALYGGHSARFVVDGDTVEMSRAMAIRRGVRFAQIDKPTGSAVNLPAFVPAASTVDGTAAYTSVALGTSSGLTGYSLGIPGSPTRYGTQATPNFNATIDNRSWPAGQTAFHYPSDQAFLVTANGGSFDGTGTIEVTATFTEIRRGGVY